MSRAYDPYRQPWSRRVRPLTAKQSLALYLYETAVMFVVVGVFIAVIVR